MTTAAPGSGLGALVQSAPEVTYGTFVTPTKAHVFESFEVAQVPVYADGKGLRGGTLVVDSNDHVLTNLDAAGSAKGPVYYNGLLRFFGSVMGGLAVAPVQNGSTTAYTTTLPFASTWNQSLSFQQIIADVSQTQRNWQIYGAKVTQLDLDCAAGSLLNATWMLDAQDRFLVASAAASLSPPTGNPPWAFHQMQVKIGAFGSEAKVDGVTKIATTIKRAQADKRFNAGNVTLNPNKVYGVKDQPVDNGFADISGTLDTEYLSDSLFDNYYQTETPFSLIWLFTSAVLAGTGFPYSLSINFPYCKFNKGDPTVAGPDIIKPSMPFTVYNDETHAPCTITVVNQDTAQ